MLYTQGRNLTNDYASSTQVILTIITVPGLFNECIPPKNIIIIKHHYER